MRVEPGSLESEWGEAKQQAVVVVVAAAVGIVAAGVFKPNRRFGWDSSETRFCTLLHFGQLYKAWGNNYFAQNGIIFMQIL